MLGDDYRQAAEQLRESGKANRGTNSPEFHMADHLMLLYWIGEIGLESNGILAQFYANADDELCAHAFQRVGWTLERVEAAISEDVLIRLKQLWRYRLEEARKSPFHHVAELSQFGWWFASARFVDPWAIEQLTVVLKIGGKIDAAHKVAERLVSLCSQMPHQVLECFNLMVACDREDWSAMRCYQEIVVVLKQTDGIDDAKVKKARSDLLGRMVNRGFQFQS